MNTSEVLLGSWELQR